MPVDDDDRERAARFDLAHLPEDYYADPYPYYRALPRVPASARPYMMCALEHKPERP